MERSLNIVVVGKSGAGKSSLLNYIAGKDLFITGAGAPVTKDYFNLCKYHHPVSNVVYNLYDTKGIEPDTINEFEENVVNKISEFSDSEDFFDHIHTLYYCVASSSKRIESYEVNFIKNISKKVDVVIVLTKSDLVGEPDKTEIKDLLKNEVGASENQVDAQIRMVEVCSVEVTTRKGISLPYGKEGILNHSLLGLWDAFAKHISQKIYDVVYITSIHTTFNEDMINVSNSFENNVTFNDAITSLSLEELEFDEFTPYDRSIVYEFLSASLRIFNQIPTLISCLDEFKIFTKNEIKNIIEFYSQLTSKSIFIPVPLQSSNRKIEEIKQILDKSEVNNLQLQVNNLLEIIRKCNSSDGWFNILFFVNKAKFEISYNEYIENCSFIDKEIMKLLNEYENIFKTELISYGKIIISPLSNNDGEKDFVEEVHFAFKDGSIINSTAKRYLDRVRLKNNISEERANEIIEQIRSEL